MQYLHRRGQPWKQTKVVMPFPSVCILSREQAMIGAFMESGEIIARGRQTHDNILRG